MSDYISHDHEHDGIDRRGFLQCMAWAGTGLLWTVSGGVLVSKTLAEIAKAGTPLPATDLSFLQISDSHIGFNKEANKDVTATFQIALDRINAMPTPPSFLIHTGVAGLRTFSTCLESMMCSTMAESFTVNGI
jgi:hypothetical protein